MTNFRFCAGFPASTIALLILATVTTHAATVVQPDIRFGVSHLDNAGFTSDDEFDATGGEIEAKVKLGFVDERSSVVLIPMIRYAQYSGNQVSDREEQRLQFNWFRDFQTAASSTTIDFNRQDLFSSEFRDFLPDPDEIPDEDGSDSGVVETESTRNRLHLRQDFAKAIGQRNSLILGVDYADVDYASSAETSRVDFNIVRADAAWRRTLSERTSVSLRAGAGQYDGDNDVTTDLVNAQLAFDIAVSEMSDFFVSAGYENADTEQSGVDLGSNGEFVFNVGAQRQTELSRFRVSVDRGSRPTSIGGVTIETGIALYFDRRLTERVTFDAGMTAFRRERSDVSPTTIDDDRDYFSVRLRMSWRLSQQWSIEASASHRRQEFDVPVTVDGSSSEDRSRLFLNLRYRGLQEVPIRSDRRFLR